MLFSKRLKDLDMFSATKISTMHAYNDKAIISCTLYGFLWSRYKSGINEI